jgi:hypothetical protein
MTSLRRSVVSISLLFLLAACATSTSRSLDPTIERESRALGMLYLEAVEGAKDCTEIGPRLDAAFANQSARIELVANARVPAGGIGPTRAEQERLHKAAQKVDGCKSQLGATAGAQQSLAPLGKLARPVASQKTAVNCYENCCIKGWETWAAVAFWTAACAGGSNQACCMMVTIASYDACIELYCPTNQCCSDVPVSVPPGP